MIKAETIDGILYLVVDLFCGAGGVTIGYEKAKITDEEIRAFLRTQGVHTEKKIRLSQVIACINHDHLAIKSHHANNPKVVHFEEDITHLYGSVKYGILMQSDKLRQLVRLIDIYRAFYPEAKLMLKVPELILIQGFPADYILLGNQTDQKKFIGNSVVPLVVEAWIRSFFIDDLNLRMAA